MIITNFSHLQLVDSFCFYLLRFLLFLPASSVFSLKKFRFRRDNLSLAPRRILRLVRHTDPDLLHKILRRKVLNLRPFKNSTLSIKKYLLKF